MHLSAVAVATFIVVAVVDCLKVKEELVKGRVLWRWGRHHVPW